MIEIESVEHRLVSVTVNVGGSKYLVGFKCRVCGQEILDESRVYSKDLSLPEDIGYCFEQSKEE